MVVSISLFGGGVLRESPFVARESILAIKVSFLFNSLAESAGIVSKRAGKVSSGA